MSNQTCLKKFDSMKLRVVFLVMQYTIWTKLQKRKKMCNQSCDKRTLLWRSKWTLWIL